MRSWVLIAAFVLLITGCAKKEDHVFDNPADPQSTTYVGHEVRDPADPINVPEVEITDAPTTIKINVAYTYVAAASDPNPAGLHAGQIVRYDWDFGDGTKTEDASASEQHTYMKDGTYLVRVTVTDDDGNTKTSTRQVTVTRGQYPVAYPGSSYTVKINVPLMLYGSGTDADGRVVRYEWDFDGDSMYEWSSTTSGQTSHTYAIAGTYTARLRVTDDDGNMDTRLVQVEVFERYYDVSTVQLDRTLTGHTRRVSSVAVSPDGQYVVSGSWDNTVKVWRLSDGALVHRLAGHMGYVSSVAVSPDAQYVVSGSADSTVKVWRLSDGALVCTLTGHTSWVESVAVSPPSPGGTQDGQYVVSGSWDNTVKVWRLADGTLMHTLTEHTGWIESVAVSPDGQYVVSGSLDKTVKMWRLADGVLVRTLTEDTGVRSVAVSPDGQYVVSGSYEEIKVWRLADGALVQTLTEDTGYTGTVWSVAVSPDGQYVVSGTSDAKVWRLFDGARVCTLIGRSSVESVAVSPDGQYVVSGALDGTVKVWRAQQ